MHTVTPCYCSDLRVLLLVIRGDMEGDEELVVLPPDELEQRGARHFITALSQSVSVHKGWVV